MNEQSAAQESIASRDLLASVWLLGVAFAAVLAGLALDANWRKLLRVLIAAPTYVCVLLTLFRVRGVAAASGGGLPPWPFCAAAAAAELASGWLRAGVAAHITFWVAPLAAVLIGGLHWLGLRYWRPLRERIMGRGRVGPRQAA